MRQIFQSNYFASLLVIFIVTFIFYPISSFDFVWDDSVYLLHESIHLNPNFVKDVFSTPFLGHYYRPIATLWIYGEANITSADPVIMHSSNVVAHLLNTSLLLAISIKLINRYQIKYPLKQILIVYSGLFFGLHPALVEPVTWISGRFDIALTFFLLLALLSDIVIKSQYIRAICVGFFFFLAALCKEMAVGFALMLPFWHLLISNRSIELSKNSLKLFISSVEFKIYLSIFSFGILYLFLRYLMLGFMLNTSYVDGSAATNLLTEQFSLVLKTAGMYFKTILFPFLNISPTHYQKFPVSMSDITSLLTLFILLLVVVSHLTLYKTRKVSYLLTAILASLFPVLHIIPLSIRENIIHERFVLFPVAITILLSLNLFCQNKYQLTNIFKKTIFFLFSLLLVTNIANTLLTIPLWKNNLTLWTWASTIDPESRIARMNYAIELCNIGNTKISLPIVDTLIKEQASSKLFITKGGCLANEEKFSDSEVAYLQALEYKLDSGEDYARILIALATVQLKQNKLKDIEYLLDKSLMISPRNHKAFFQYHNYYFTKGNFKRAKEKIDLAIKFSASKEQKNYYLDIKSKAIIEK